MTVYFIAIRRLSVRVASIMKRLCVLNRDQMRWAIKITWLARSMKSQKIITFSFSNTAFGSCW